MKSRKSVPITVSISPIGAIEKILKPGRPACWRLALAIRNAGAPIIVIVVPSDAAKERGINNFDGKISRSREKSMITGIIKAVVVRWCVNA
jgi:hypothetical protein